MFMVPQLRWWTFTATLLTPDSGIPTCGQGEQFCAADLCDQAGRIEVDALVDDAVVVKEEHRDDRHSERLARRRHAVELAEVRSQQIEFDDDRVVGAVKAGIVVTLVRERCSCGQ